MAIYTPKEKFQAPKDLSMETSLSPISFKYGALDEALEAYRDVQDRAFEREEKQFQSFKTHYDTLTSIPLDNELQREKFKKVREKHGIGDDAFSQIALDPSNPKSVAKLERGFRRISADRDFQEILQDQQRAAKYMDGTSKITNPGLQAEAVRAYEDYRAGKISATQLNLGQYEEIDTDDVMAKKLARIPFGISQELIENGTYIREVKARGKAAVEAVFQDSMKDPRFRNNMLAQGYMERNEQGELILTQAGEQYKAGLVDAYSAEQEKLIQQKQAAALTGKEPDSPGNPYTGTSSPKRGHYNSVSSRLQNSGVDVNDPQVQRYIQQQLELEAAPSQIEMTLGIAKSPNPLKVIYDTQIAITGAGQWPTYADFQAAVKRGDAAALEQVDAALEQTSMVNRRQAVIADASVTPTAAAAPGAAPVATPAAPPQAQIPGTNPGDPFQAAPSAEDIRKASAQHGASRQLAPPAASAELGFDPTVLEGFEGGALTDGYVPSKGGKAIAESGVTISAGIDLGQQSEQSLKDMGLSDQMIEKLKPYIGLRKQEAIDALEDNPLTITPEEATELRDKAFAQYEKNTAKAVGEQYDSLPKPVKTALVSFYYQRGPGYFKNSGMKAAAAAGDLDKIEQILRAEGEYKKRRGKEADLVASAKKQKQGTGGGASGFFSTP